MLWGNTALVENAEESVMAIMPEDTVFSVYNFSIYYSKVFELARDTLPN